MSEQLKAAHTAEAERDPKSLKHVPFVHHLGVVVDHMEPGRAILSLDPKPEHYNSWGGVHGGVIMTLLDIAMAIAGRSFDPVNLSGVTVDMSSSFISPGKGKQIATGRVSRNRHRCGAAKPRFTMLQTTRWWHAPSAPSSSKIWPTLQRNR